VTCGDDGVPMRVMSVDTAASLALCTGEDGAHDDAAVEEVAIELVDPVSPGDTLLVHAGVALVRLEERMA